MPVKRVGYAGQVPLHDLDIGLGRRLFVFWGGLETHPAEQVADHLQADAEQHERHEQFERPDIRQPVDADKASDDDPRHGPGHDDPRQRPEHPFFAVIAEHAARIGEHVVELVRRADRGIGVAQKGHLKRQQQERAGNPAHRREEGNGERDQRRYERRNFDFRSGEIHLRHPPIRAAGAQRATDRPTAARPYRFPLPPAAARHGA